MSISGIGSGVSSFLTAGLRPTGGSAASSSLFTDQKDAAQAVKDDFLKYAQMTPAERMRAQILAEMGLKEEDLNSMDTKTRQAVEDRIKDQIKMTAEKSAPGKTGLLVDVSA